MHCRRSCIEAFSHRLSRPHIINADTGTQVKRFGAIFVRDRHLHTINLFQQYSHAFFFCQQHKVVAAHACEIFVWFQLLPCQPYKFPQHHITLPCSYGTVDVVEILNVQKCTGILLQFSLCQQFSAGFVDAAGVESTGQQIRHCNAFQKLHQLYPFQQQEQLTGQKQQHLLLYRTPCSAFYGIIFKNGTTGFVHLHMFPTARLIKTFFILIEQEPFVLSLRIQYRRSHDQTDFKLSQRKKTHYFLHLLFQQRKQFFYCFHVLLQFVEQLTVTLHMKVHIHTITSLCIFSPFSKSTSIYFYYNTFFALCQSMTENKLTFTECLSIIMKHGSVFWRFLQI